MAVKSIFSAFPIITFTSGSLLAGRISLTRILLLVFGICFTCIFIKGLYVNMSFSCLEIGTKPEKTVSVRVVLPQTGSQVHCKCPPC